MGAMLLGEGLGCGGNTLELRVNSRDNGRS